MTDFESVPITDAFALRNRETVEFCGENVPDVPNHLGLLLRGVNFPEGPKMELATSPHSVGEPVMPLAILACQKTRVGWVWIQLAPQTKEYLGNLLLKWNVKPESWNFVTYAQVP